MAKRFGVIGILLLLSACGGDNPSGPSPFSTTVSGSVDVFGTNRHTLNIQRSGTMTLALAWQDGVVDLDLYLAGSSCSSLYPKAACNIVQSASTSSGTSERISRTVTSGEAFNIFVDNISATRTQGYNITITIQ